MADDIFNKGINQLRLPDFAKELQTGREFQRQSQRAPARTSASATRPIDVAAALIRNARERKQLDRALGTGGDMASALSAAVGATPTWEQTRLQLGAGFESLPFSEQSKLYDSYLQSAVDRLKTVVPAGDDEDEAIYDARLREAVRANNPAPTEPSRTWGELAGDIGRGIGAGAAGLFGTLESAVQVASGEDPTQTFGSTAAQSLRAGMSAVEQDRQRQIAFELAAIQADPEASTLGKFMREAGVQVSNLSAAGVAELAGNVLPTLGVGFGVGLGVRGVAAAVGLNAARATAAASAAGVGTSAALEAASTAGDAASQAYETIMGMTPDDLADEPEWQAALEQAGGDPEAAKRLLAQDASELAAAIGGTAGGALSLLPGTLERGVGTAVARRLGLSDAAEQSLSRRAAALAGTAGMEGATEVASPAAANIATGQPVLEGAGSDFALGALGGVVGAGVNRVLGGPAEAADAPPSPTGAPGAPVDEGDGAPDTPNIPEGTEFNTDDGATLVADGNGGWTYHPDSPRTPIGDALAPPAPAPAPTGDPLDPADPETDDAGTEPAPAPAPADPEAEPAPVGEPAPIPEPTPDPEPIDETPTPIEPAPEPVEPTVEGMTQAAQFEANLRSAAATQGFSVDFIDRLNRRLQPLLEEIAQLQSNDDLSNTQRIHSLRTAAQTIFSTMRNTPGLGKLVRTARRSMPDLAIGPLDGSPLGYLVGTLGIDQQLKGSRDRWAMQVRDGKTTGEEILGTLAYGDSSIAPVTRAGANAMRQAFRAAGIPVPRVQFNPTDGRRRTAGGVVVQLGHYNPNTHTVVMNGGSNANTLVHEMIHGLTSRGIIRIERIARGQQGATEQQRQDAQDLLELLHQLHAKLRDSASGQPGGYYGNTDLHEMLAEMLSPDFLALAMQTPIGTLSPGAQRALDASDNEAGSTVFDAMVKAIKKIIDLIAPGNKVKVDTVAYALTQAAGLVARNAGPNSWLTSDSATDVLPQQRSQLRTIDPDSQGAYSSAPDSLMGMSRQPAAPFDEQNYRHVEFVEVRHPNGNVQLDAMRGLNTVHALERARRNWPGATITRLGRADVRARDPDLLDEVDQLMARGQEITLPDDVESRPAQAPLPGVGNAAANAAAATQQGANNVTGPVKPPSPRVGYGTLVGGMATGAQAAPASLPRGTTQALKSGNMQAAAHSLSQIGEFLNTKLHDHLAPVKRWFQTLDDSTGGITPALKQRAIDTLYLAPGVRDQVLSAGMDRFGGRELNQHLAKLSNKYRQFTPETIIQYVGYWITAQRVPTGNRILIQKDTDALTEANKLLAAAQASGDLAEINAAQRAANVAAAQLAARVAAVMNTSTSVKVHGGGGVAGMNNAQAARMAATIEQHFDKADLQEAAELVYDINAWRLVTDIETGKVTPNVAAAFLRQPGVQPLLDQVALAARNFSATDPQSAQVLDAARLQAISAVRSNYVPLTGDPGAAQDEEIFQTGTKQPNVSGDYELTGRTTSIPDDAITATFAGVTKTASYAGWAPFQDAVAELYNAMTPAQRDEYGLHRVDVNGSGALIGENAIIRRRGNQVYAYQFRDRGLMEAIRGSNVDSNNFALNWLGHITRAYAYGATQLNPFFAPKNYLRDFWERSELIRTREYVNANGQRVDSTKLARRMLSYLGVTPAGMRLMKATTRYAFGMKHSNSFEGRALEEFLREGGVSVYGDRFARTRIDMVNAILKEKGWRKQLQMLGKMVGTYNRVFDLAPALASYIAMREQNMTAEAAAAGALDLMNFRKRGEVTPALSAVYAFAQPAITGGANAISALYNPVTGQINRRGWVRLGAYTVAFLAAQALFRGMADDDEGGDRIDQQSEFTKNSHILIPVGDEGFIKIPLAFGLTRVANGMARALIGAGTGEMTPGEAAGGWFGGSVVPVVSPIEDTDISWTDRPVQALMMTFTPSWLKPVMSVGMNLTPWGTKVVYDNYAKTDQYRSEQFGKRIPPEYKEIAVFLRQQTGIDLAPEEVRTIMRGYPLGPGTMLLNGVVENPYKRAGGREVTNPLLQQVYSRYSDTAIHFQFREAIDSTNELKKRVNAGGELSDAERRELLWRENWDAVDKDLRKQKARITRDRTMTADGKEARKAALDQQRMRSETLALYQYRTATGQPATRRDIPAELAPPPMR